MSEPDEPRPALHKRSTLLIRMLLGVSVLVSMLWIADGFTDSRVIEVAVAVSILLFLVITALVIYLALSQPSRLHIAFRVILMVLYVAWAVYVWLRGAAETFGW